MPRKSDVWNHFIRIAEKKVRCNHCDREYKSCGNTSNLLQHLERKHPLSFKSQMPDDEEIDLIEPPAKSLRSQIFIEETFHSLNYREDNYKAFIINERLIELVLRVGLDYSIVDSEPFQQFVKTLDHHYSVPSKKRLSEMIDQKYDQKKNELIQFFETLDSLSLSIDMWADSHDINYVSVTCHFASEYKLHHVILGVRDLVKGDNSSISSSIDDILRDFDIIPDKVTAVITDGGLTTREAIIGIFGSNKHHICFGHLIQQLLQDTLLSTPEIVKIMESVRQIVDFFKKNKNYQEILLRRQEVDGRTPVKLKQETKNNWISVYPMVANFLELRKYIESILFEINNPPEYPKEFECIVLEDFLNLLKPFHDVANEMLRDGYTLISKQLPLVKCLESYLLSIKPTTNIGNILKAKFISNVCNQFLGIEDNPLIALSTLIDPRFKRLHFHNVNSLSIAISLLDRMVQSIPSSISEMDSSINSSDRFWAHHESIVQSLDQQESDIDLNISTTLRRYLGYPLIPRVHCPLEYWSNQRKIYPELSKLALKYLTIPSTSLTGKEIFSKYGRSLSEWKIRLKPNRLNKFLFLRDVPNVHSSL